MKLNLIGQKYNRLTVISKAPTQGKRGYWNVKCECGTEFKVRTDSLRNGHTKSCGCIHKEILDSGVLRRKYKRPKTYYKRWKSMIRRCENVNDSAYQYYGAKGISVCDEWRNDYDKFYDWMKKQKKPKSYQLDRIDSEGNYEPSNCQLLTASDNSIKAMNKRYGKE